MDHKNFIFKFFLLSFLVFMNSILLWSHNKENKKPKEKKEQKIIEEIVVTAEAPRETLLSKVSIIKAVKIMESHSKNLSDIMNYSTGVYVTQASKNEARVQIRGLESRRITLLYDGIPVYEPYFNSFDLKSFSASEIESIKVIKGASSVLYGPNTLGGIINVITQRPEANSFSLDSQFSENSTNYLSGTGKWILNRFSFLGSVSYDKSNGFDWMDRGTKKLRNNSQYERMNFIGKMYCHPGPSSEILAEIFYLNSEYGIPWATEYYRKRYWRFNDWKRAQFNLGGTFPLFNKGFLKVRSYYVRHFNVLDAYQNDLFTDLRWESTYKNYTLGTFLIGDIPLSPGHGLKFSCSAKRDQVNIQDDVGEEWEKVFHNTYSAGLEDHIMLSPKIKMIGGISFDHLDKKTGPNRTSVNPIIGIKLYPKEWMDFYLSYSRKARFPSMKSLYSTSSGNPDLSEEIGQNYEAGLTFKKNYLLSGAIFINRIQDLINSIRFPSGFTSYENIGIAVIRGFELGFSKKFSDFELSLNYTYLDTENKDDGNPLDYIPKAQFNFFVNTREFKGFSFSFWGMAVSSSQALFKDYFLNIPGYFLLNVVAKKKFSRFSLFLKAENILNQDYFTEPGFPMRARTISLGINISTESKKKNESS
jgi:iron complex outermembrane receptor protein